MIEDDIDPKAKKSAQTVSFSKPPTSAELLADQEYKDRFDKLPGRERHLVKRLMDHGDLKRAAKEAGFKPSVGKALTLNLAPKRDIKRALEAGGVDSDFIVGHLVDCLNGEVTRLDKHGNAIMFVDYGIKLKALDMILKLRGDYNVTKDDKAPSVDLFEDTNLDDE